MVDERDDNYELPDDGEYHFSDDQVNYDIDPDAAKEPDVEVKPGPAAVASAVEAGSLMSRLRRPLIGLGVFVVLIFLVYKLIAPAPTTPMADFAPGASAPAPAVAVTTKAAETSAPDAKLPDTKIPAAQPGTAPTPAASLPAIPATQPAAAPAMQVPAGATQQSALPALPQPAPATTSNAPAAPSANPNAAATVSTPLSEPKIPSPSVNIPAPSSAGSGASDALAGEMASTSSVEKMMLLQQQNAKLISQLQSDTAQRISSYQEHAAEMDNKIQELNAHISKIESTLEELSKTIQDLKPNAAQPIALGTAKIMPPADMTQASAAASGVVQPAKPMPSRSAPKVNYSVQAIIPGRAWLKSDGGDTVTVAEGDMLKGAGRVMKIDPYDGVVEIDVRGRIVALTYGTAQD